MFHVLVIGAASHSEHGGQLPHPEHIAKFAKIDGKTAYYYFIDPDHYDSKSDGNTFGKYYEHNVAFCIINRTFNFVKFREEYKINVSESALFVDYANLTSSEYDFIVNLGNNPNWLYWSPGCSGERLDIGNAINTAKNIPRYNLYSTSPVPRNLSVNYQKSIATELNTAIVFVRLIPLDRDEKLPDWLATHKLLFGTDFETRLMIRESSLKLLTDFFTINGVDIHSINPTDWLSVGKKVLASAVPPARENARDPRLDSDI